MSTVDVPAQHALRRLVLLVAFVWLMLFSNLGGYDLSAPDEPRFALVAREMLTNGHWLQPHRNDRPYPDKPPLFFWSIAGVSALNGGEVNAWTARLPSALAAVWVLYLMWGFARTRDPERDTALLTVLTLLGSVRFFFQAHMAQIDMVLCGLTTAAACLGFQLTAGLTAPEKRAAATRNLGLLLGLAILAKGPVGYLVPAGGMAVYAAFSGRETWRRYPRKALLWGLVPPLVWLGLLLIEVAIGGHWDYLNNLLFKQTVVRYLNPWHHYKPFYYFAQVLLYDFMPWVFLLLAAIPWRKATRLDMAPRTRFAWAMVVFTLCFFSLSKGKRNLYILPLYPFAAYLVAVHMRDLLRRIHTRPVWGMVVPGLLLAVVGGACLALGLGGFEDRVLDAIGELSLPHGAFTVIGGLCLAAGLWALVAALRGRVLHGFAGLLTAMALLNVLLYQVALPWISPVRSARAFTEEATRIVAASPREPLIGMVLYRSAYRFYGRYPLVELATEDDDPPGLPRAQAFLADHPDAWLIVRRKHLEAFPPAFQQSLKVHLEVTVGRGEDMMLVTRAQPPVPDQAL